MANILILILVAIAITAVTAKLKEVVDYIASQFDKEVKSSLIIATILGVVAGLSLQLGLVDSVAQATADVFGELPDLPKYFTIVDIGFSCVGLSAGSGFFIKIIEKFTKDGKEAIGNASGEIE